MDGEIWEARSVRPRWLTRFCHRVSEAIELVEATTIGCHSHPNQGSLGNEWEVTVFVASDESTSSDFRWNESSPPFMVDLRGIVDAFDTVDDFYWQAERMAEDDDLGPHVGVTGTFEGHRVWLRVTARPPEDLNTDDWEANAGRSDDRW